VKKILVILVLLSVGFVGGVSWKELTAHAGGGGGVPLGNGDVNGDGVYDISDAVYFLYWRFLGGPAPVAIECSPTGLPATGQTKCYTQEGEETECSGTGQYPGQDAFFKAGCPSEGRFVDNKDDTVTDTCTGLMWQKNTADVDGNGSIGDEDRLNWRGALKYCESLSFAGHDDWRLPNVRELQSIVDYGRVNPAIDPIFGALSDWHWSSSSNVLNPYLAWVVYFSGGFVTSGLDDVGFYGYARAVRSGP